MKSNDRNEPAQNDTRGWRTIASGDNGVDLLEYDIKVADFTEAATVGSEIASALAKYERTGDDYDAYFNQITLRAWQVEVIVAVPKEGPRPNSQQQEFMDMVSSRYTAAPPVPED